jgi:hypothetical protein
MLVLLASARGRGDLVRGPPGAEVLVLDRQLADERGERGIVGVLRGLHPQCCNCAARRADPIAVEPSDRRIVEEHVHVVAAGRLIGVEVV